MLAGAQFHFGRRLVVMHARTSILVDLGAKVVHFSVDVGFELVI